MKKNKSLKTLSFLIFLYLLPAQEAHPYPPLNLVSIPTAGTLPKGNFTLEMLLQNGGGVLPKLAVGLTDHFTIGMSYGVQNFIGNERSSFTKQTPEVLIKYRVYAETESWPAFVVGLDTQGRGYYHEESSLEEGESMLVNRYDQKAWGVFLVASKNWELFGNFGMHLGVCKNNWENKDGDSDVNLFFGFDKELNRSFSLLVEYDAALNDNEDLYDYDEISFGKGKGYLNAGVRWAIAHNLLLELNVNDIALNNDRTQYANREVKIMFSETF